MSHDHRQHRKAPHKDHSISLMNSDPTVTDRLTDIITNLTTGPKGPPTILCGRCLVPKREAEYYESDLRRKIRRCRPCRIEVQRERWQACKALVDGLKDIDCPDCGLRWPPECMEFDHRDPAAKDIALSAIVASGSMSRLRAELVKGEFVCSNCHRIRTGGFRYRLGFTGRGKPGEFLARLAAQRQSTP